MRDDMHSEAKKSVLVTGGRGFVGRAVVNLLRRKGYPVLSLDRSPIRELAHEDSTGEFLCELGDMVGLQGLFERNPISGVIHLAAMLPTAAQQNPLAATQVNIQGSVNVFEMARLFRVQRFVFGSSLSIYGTYPASRTVSEFDPAAPEDLYGAAKLYVEQFGQACRERFGTNFASLRIGRVVGAGSNSVSSAWRSEIFELLRTDKPAEIIVPYRPSERILVVHVDDVAAMLLALVAATKTEHAIYNAPCESILVGDLKRVVESLNPKLTVRLGDGRPAGNPQMLDFSRFDREFAVQTTPIFDRLEQEAGR